MTTHAGKGSPEASRDDLPIASALAPGLEVVATVPSTNAELARRERIAPQAHLTALATLDQTSGRGRLGRTWSADAGASLAVSVVIRPQAIPADRLGLITLLGGLAARAAVAAELPAAPVSLKWPNDVIIAGRKIAGVLAEVVQETGAVILGVGINTAMREEQLPVPTATSIAIQRGGDEDPAGLADRVLAAFLTALADLVARFELAAGDIDRDGIRDEIEAATDTLGREVSVELPDGSRLLGRAIGIGADGALLVAARETGAHAAILAGDVTHLRYQ